MKDSDFNIAEIDYKDPFSYLAYVKLRQNKFIPSNKIEELVGFISGYSTPYWSFKSEDVNRNPWFVIDQFKGFIVKKHGNFWEEHNGNFSALFHSISNSTNQKAIDCFWQEWSLFENFWKESK